MAGVGYLTPLDPERRKNFLGDFRDQSRFLVFDIEAANWTEFLIGGVFDGVSFFYFATVHECLEHFFSYNETLDVYAHFGGGYDFLFLLQEIFKPVRGNYLDFTVEEMVPWGLSGKTLLSIKIKSKQNPNISITLRDSLAMLPFGLKELGKQFNVKHKKLEIDVEHFTEVTPEMLKYNEQDCRCLWECIDAFRNIKLIKDVGLKATTASQAMAIFRTYLKTEIKPTYNYRKQREKESLLDYYEEMFQEDTYIRGGLQTVSRLNPISRKVEKVTEDVIPAYFGGRAEVFVPEFDGPGVLNYYDVNSLYPSVMAFHQYPGRKTRTVKKYHEGMMGFFDVLIHVPEDMWIPPLGVILNDKFIFPTGTFRGKWSGAELQYALSLGCTIEKDFGGVLYSNEGYLFKEYILDLYKKRKEAKENGDSVMEVILKLIMNSSYGRFAMDPRKEELGFFEWREGSTPIECEHMCFDTPEGVKMLALNPKMIPTFSNIAIAAYITSYARIKLHSLLSQCERGTAYYCDTDSVICEREFPSSLELGEFKLEDEILQGSFILPKTYSYVSKKSQERFEEGKAAHIFKTRAKGLDKIASERIGPEALSEYFRGRFELEKAALRGTSKARLEAMRQELVKISTTKMSDDGGGKGLKGLKRALKEDKNFVSRDKALTRTLQGLYSKRKIVEEGGRVFTMPWELGEGEILNADKKRA